MSIVVCDVDNQYCSDLCYSYQIIKEDNDTYSVYVSYDVFRGKTIAKNLETFQEAFNILSDKIDEVEFV